MRRTIMAVALVLITTGCSTDGGINAPADTLQSSSTEPQSTRPTPPPSGTEAATTTVPPSSPGTTSTAPSTGPPDAALPGAAPDAAWLGGFGCGLTILDRDGTWHPLRGGAGALDTDQIMDIAGADDGRIFVATSLRTWSIDADGWRDIDGSGPEAIAVDPVSGAAWAVDYQTVAVWDGTGWTEYPATLLGEGDYVELVKDVAVADDGAVWVATNSTVAVLDGAGWTWWGNGNGFPDSAYPFNLDSIAIGVDGAVWVSHGTGLLRFDGASWTAVDPGVGQPHDITVAPDGRVLVSTWSDGLAVFDGGWSILGPDTSPLQTGRVRSAFVDGRDRLWIGTTWGITVIDGPDAVTYTMATSGLAGNCVDSIYVSGDGPDLPATTPAIVGSLTGSVTLDGAPLADAGVVLCSEQPQMLYSGAHPCEGFPVGMLTRTDADGRYAFSDVPIGDYELAWEVEEGSWRSYLVGGVEPVVRAGETTELPTVEVGGD